MDYDHGRTFIYDHERTFKQGKNNEQLSNFLKRDQGHA